MVHVIGYLVERVQHFVRHVVLDHHGRYEHLVEVGVLRPERLEDGLVLRQGLPVNVEDHYILFCMQTAIDEFFQHIGRVISEPDFFFLETVW